MSLQIGDHVIIAEEKLMDGPGFITNDGKNFNFEKNRVYVIENIVKINHHNTIKLVGIDILWYYDNWFIKQHKSGFSLGEIE